jgi:hypothetical protein
MGTSHLPAAALHVKQASRNRKTYFTRSETRYLGVLAAVLWQIGKIDN